MVDSMFCVTHILCLILLKFRDRFYIMRDSHIMPHFTEIP